MALINRIGGAGGLQPVGTQTDLWSQNRLSRGRFVTLSGAETALQSSTAVMPGADLVQMGLQGGGRFSRSPEGSVLWNFTGYGYTKCRLERQAGDGSFSTILLNRCRTVSKEAYLYGEVTALSNDRAVVAEGAEYAFSQFHVVEYADGALTEIAAGMCSAHPMRGDWVMLPGPDSDSFIYLSKDRCLMKGQIADGAITFTVLDSTRYQNIEQLVHASEDAYNKLFGCRLADGSLLMCWNQVTRILTSGEEEEYDEDLGMTLYWPYETFLYDLFLTRLDKNGAHVETMTLAQGIEGARSTMMAGPLDDLIPLPDGRALLQVNLSNNHTAAGRKACLVTVGDSGLLLEEGPQIFRDTVHWELLDRAEGDPVLARVTAWGTGGVKTSDAFRPQLEFYRLQGSEMVLLYKSECVGVTHTAGYSGSFYWQAEWSAAGRCLVFGGRWSPNRDELSRLLARWESGYRCGKAGEQYAGLCGRSSGADGVFGLIAPAEA